MCGVGIVAMTNKSRMTRINITVPEDLLEEFKEYCDSQVRSVSSQIQFFMKQAVESSQEQKGNESS